MTSATLLRFFTGNDAPGLLRAIRADLGCQEPEDLGRALGWGRDSDLAGMVRQVEAGEPTTYPWGADSVTRGAVALWLLRAGGWSPPSAAGLGYHRTDGARVSGNAMTSYAHLPGRREILRDTHGPEDEGPVIRRDVLRLMLRVEALLGPAPTPHHPESP